MVYFEKRGWVMVSQDQNILKGGLGINVGLNIAFLSSAVNSDFSLIPESNG